ncbi:UPF0182 family protein [Methylovulum psychrotolerans]|jgi:hypothetical protein|uniref:Uncharacterized protein n=1 Tax=Methylovulum psychrotolerans TaxID=1704499 RepID=A0A1Z4BWI5_9GAMM|nr:UPF0182 family protein [Methylovulum psychrotolerans]ASF45648.1 hypothetical protein CEK71_05950 [Methylovulum psychrotolerans]
MGNLKSLPALIGSALVIMGILYIAFHFIFLDLFVDLWWFESLKLENYFWLKLLYKYLLSGAVTLGFFAIFFLHFWIASSYLGLNPPDDVRHDVAKRQKFQKIANTFMSGSAKVYTPISLVLAIIIAIPFYTQWETALLYFFGSNSGVNDNVYGQDISFYLLFYPVYQLVQQELLGTAILIFAMIAALYWLEHTLIPNQRKDYPKGAKIHLSLLLGFVVGFVVWGFMLQRFALLHSDSHEPIFYGPGFIELRYQLPLIWAAIGTFLATAVTAGLFIFWPKHRIKTPFLVSLTAFVCVLVLPKIGFIPSLLQRYLVNPNPVKTEKPFIQNNIDATLAAYQLGNIKQADVSINLNAAKDIETWGTQKRFENIPVWDREFIIDSYRQLQEIRPYYHFRSVDEDRYFVLDHIRQVNISARELNTSKLPQEAKNWENLHLRYTHGYGAVISPAAQDADKPQVWYLRDLNMTSDIGLSTAHPDIYYGQEQFDYAIVPNKLDIVGIAGTDPSQNEAYHGEGGIPIASTFRKALFAIYLHDEKIFFSTNIASDSRLKIHRNISERVAKLAPFLRLDKDPYLVITKDRFYWLMDAYTVSDKYPVSKPTDSDFGQGQQRFNYIRNSVKVVVDAFDGDVDFYIAEPKDPIIQAYHSAYPNLFKNLADMPADLRSHLRYPRDLYTIQMQMYAKYHQNSPELFYEQAETWQFANVRDKPVLPYYQTMDFGNCNDSEEFVLINPMTPVNRNNLSMIGVASTIDSRQCGKDYQPSITVYQFGKDVQVNGPAQIEALTQQVPEISAQFTLWGQSESIVEMGRMIILPMGNTVLYVQPIYIASVKNKMPELTRVIVSIGNETVMDKTIAGAFEKLKQIFIKNAGPVSRVMPTIPPQ